MKIVKLFLVAISMIIRMPMLHASRCHLAEDNIENLDASVAFTALARDNLSHNICGDMMKAGYIKRYINQQVEETNRALGKACVPYAIRIVYLHLKPWLDPRGDPGGRLVPFDETSKSRDGI